jgi:hypothetical protein
MILLMDSCSWLAYHWGFNVCWWIKILIRYSHIFLSTSGPWQIYQYNNYRLNIYWFFYFSFVNNSTGNYLWNIFYCYFHRKYPTQMFYHYFHRTLPTNCLSQCVCVRVYDTSFDQLGISFKKLQNYFNFCLTLFKVINSNSSGTSYT